MSSPPQRSPADAPGFVLALAGELYREEQGSTVDNLIDFSLLGEAGGSGGGGGGGGGGVGLLLDFDDASASSVPSAAASSSTAGQHQHELRTAAPTAGESSKTKDSDSEDEDDVLAVDPEVGSALSPLQQQQHPQPQQKQQQQQQEQQQTHQQKYQKHQQNQGGDSPSRDPSRPRRVPKVSAYARLVGKRRAHVSMADDPTVQSSVFSWAREKVLGLVAGETAEERRTRLRLNWYRQVLQAEIDVVAKARLHFSNHGKDLAIEFEMQELQLQKWGLLNILPAFRVQAWARVSRSALLEDMAVVAERILRQRLTRANDVIALYASDNKGNRKHPLDSYNAFCLGPDKVMAKEPGLTQLGHRLQRMDKVCNTSLHIFKTMLPELESRTFAQRKHMLVDIMNRYAQVGPFFYSSSFLLFLITPPRAPSYLISPHPHSLPPSPPPPSTRRHSTSR